MHDRSWTHQCNNHTVVCYKAGAGGKFLINCLGMSRYAVLQDHRLAQRQLDGDLSSWDKYQDLIARIQNTGDNWQDLGLGDGALFVDLDYEQKSYLDASNFSWHPVIRRLADSRLEFFTGANTYNKLDRILKVWPKSKVLFVVNPDNFLTTVRPRYHYRESWTIWRNIRGDSWPQHPPYFKDDLLSISQSVLQELKNQFGPEFESISIRLKDSVAVTHEKNLEKHYRHETSQTNSCHEWDCDWFLDKDRFLDEIDRLYQWIGYDDFNHTWVEEFYLAWIDKIRFCEKNR